MNIYLFMESLSSTEKEEMKQYFLKIEIAKFKEERDKNVDRIPIMEFINKNNFSTRVSTNLQNRRSVYKNGISEDIGYVFEYSDEINETQFLKIRNAGKKGWAEVDKILNKN